jgi:hypothetical protein
MRSVAERLADQLQGDEGAGNQAIYFGIAGRVGDCGNQLGLVLGASRIVKL